MAAEQEMLSGSVVGVGGGDISWFVILKGENLVREKDCRVCLLSPLHLLLMFRQS